MTKTFLLEGGPHRGTMRWVQGEDFLGWEGSFTVLSNAPWRGGLRRTHHLLNTQVPPDFRHEGGNFLRSLQRRTGWKDLVSLLTAVPRRCAVRRERPGFQVLVTAGVTHPSAGGTINILLVSEQALSGTAFVDLVKVVTEAKVSALRDYDLRWRDRPATGTSTDGVAIASLGRGKPLEFAGPITPFGSRVARNVRQMVLRGIGNFQGTGVDRSIALRLRERGIPARLVDRLQERGGLEDRVRWETVFALEDARRARRWAPASPPGRRPGIPHAPDLVWKEVFLQLADEGPVEASWEGWRG